VTPCFMSPGTYSLEHFQLVVASAQLHQHHPHTITPPQHLIFVAAPGPGAGA